jgi:hypothetical protein
MKKYRNKKSKIKDKTIRDEKLEATK